jgi:NADH-quinone oxidoreductase subunit J
MTIFHSFLCFLLIFSGASVSSSVNSIESILFLILTFFNSAIILFFFHAEFLGLVFIIVYVGAIAVLFLFVIMMLNVKVGEKTNSFINFNAVIILILIHLGGLFLSFVLPILSSGEEDPILFFRNYEKSYFFDSLYNIDVLGQVLYNHYLVCFLLAGLILLVALVGAIVLTLRFNTIQKTQSVFRQLSRTANILSFVKK